MTIHIADGETVVIRLPSGQLIRLANVRVERIEMKTQGAMYGRAARSSNFEVELYLRAEEVGHIDVAQSQRREAHDAIVELAEAAGAPPPAPMSEAAFVPIEQRPVTSSPIGPHKLAPVRFEPGVAQDDLLRTRAQMLSAQEFEEYKRLRGLL